MAEIIEQLSGINKSLSTISAFFTAVTFTLLMVIIITIYLHGRR